jgi:16S rRNA G966 N2-methylase RsmD
MNNSLAQLTEAEKMLDRASTLEDLQKIQGIAEMAGAYARAAKLGLDNMNKAAEIRLKAERKAGELLKQLDKGVGGRVNSGTRARVDSEYKETLDENEISRRKANRWQDMAEIPQDRFDDYIEATKSAKDELSQAGVLRLKKKMRTMEIATERQELAATAQEIEPSDRWEVIQADMKEWYTKEKYDFIITDPPYLKEYRHLYEELAILANDCLKDGGLLIAMAGQSYLDELYAMMSEHLTYYWTAAYLTPGQPTPLRQRNVNTTWKPLLIYSKGDYKGKIFGDVFKSEGNDKDHHKWGQSVSGMTDIVSKICLSGQKILDPFCGAGTTGIAALKHGCLFTGLDIEEENVNISKARLHDTQAE